MNKDNEILLQLFRMFQAHETILRDLERNQLVFIEAIRSGQYQPEVLVLAARSVRSNLYTLDSLGDSLRELAQKLQAQ